MLLDLETATSLRGGRGARAARRRSAVQARAAGEPARALTSGPCGSVAELGARAGRAAAPSSRRPWTGSSGSARPGCTRSPRSRASSTPASATDRPRRATAATRGASSCSRSRSTSPSVRAERALAVYTGLRSLLPEIAALAANAPFHGGVDTGLASVRPKISESLPRQGVPPPLAKLGRVRRRARLGPALPGRCRATTPGGGSCGRTRAFGTLELRVPDAQTTPEAAAAVAAFAHCLVAWLADRADAGEALRIDAELADRREPMVGASRRRRGRRSPTSRRASGGRCASCSTEMLGELEPYGRRSECAAELAGVGELIVANGAMRQRAIAAERGLHGLIGWLRERFTAPRLD